jgi:hypothetical protein
MAALNEAGLHLVQAQMKLAADLAGCENPVAAMAVCTDWTSARLNEALADQARVMSAFMALAGPALQRRGPTGEPTRRDD